MGISTVTDQNWHIVRYSAEEKERWDRFVRRSKTVHSCCNATTWTIMPSVSMIVPC